MARHRKTPSFCYLLDEMIADEKKAPIEYTRLIKKSESDYQAAPDRVVISRVVQSIIKDERRHKKMLIRMHDKVCK